MATNLFIDEHLLKEAVALGRHKTKRSAVNDALQEYVLRRKQLQIKEMFGTVDYDPDYDYKSERNR